MVPVEGAASSRRDPSLLQSPLSGIGISLRTFDSFYFKLSSISLLGKGRREAGEGATVCAESGDSGTVGKPEASWQGCVEFLGIGARKLKVKAREFSGWSGRGAGGQVSVARGRVLMCRGIDT